MLQGLHYISLAITRIYITDHEQTTTVRDSRSGYRDEHDIVVDYHVM